ncbi:hypothetical protein ACQYE5_003154 [Enterobacter cancerogenus]
MFYRIPNDHSIYSKAIHSDKQHVTIFDYDELAGKSRVLTGGNQATDALLNKPMIFKIKNSHFNFHGLVFRVLFQRGNTEVSKTRDMVKISVRNGSTNCIWDLLPATVGREYDERMTVALRLDFDRLSVV